jgi:hypothetical protein
MGFFKKIFKGVKKVFKKVGKGIKSAFKSVGRFMGKIGVLGQIAMMFVLPAIGGALMKGLGTGFNALVGKSAVFTTAGTTGTLTAGTGMLGSSSAIIRGAGQVLKAAGNFAKVGHSAFKTVTGAVGSFVKEFAGTALKKIPGMQTMIPSLQNAPDTFFQGSGNAWSKVSQKVITDGKNLLTDFNKAIGYTPPPAPVTSKLASTVSTEAAKSISVSDATLKTESLVDTLGPDGKSLTPVKEPFYPTASGKLESSLLEPQLKLAVPENILDVKGLNGKAIGQSMTGDFASKAAGTVAEKAAEDFYGIFPDGTMPAPLPKEPGFFERLGTSTKDAILSIPDKIIEAPGKFVDGLDKTVQSGLSNKLLIETGLVDSPVQNVTYEGGTVVPQMADTPFMNQYTSAAINDRAYQMSVDPSGYSMSNPWGSPANTYQQELGARYG